MDGLTMPRTVLPTVSFFLRLFFLIAVAASREIAVAPALSPSARGFSLRAPCEESFPLAALSGHFHGHHNLLVAIPDDEAGRTHAPLCPDGRRIDMRRMLRCPDDQCWSTSYQSCTHQTSPACRSNRINEGKPFTKSNTNKYRRMVEFRRKVARRRNKECGGGQCWAEMYQLCLNISSVECRNPPPSKAPTGAPTPSPTQKPTFAMEETLHAVKLTLENVPDGYELTTDVRALIIRFATETIEKYLEEPLQLIEVKFGGNLGRKLLSPSSNNMPNKRRRRRLDDVPVPLEITLMGPSNVSDFALSFVMDILQMRIQDLVSKLKEYDKETFKNVDVSGSTYDPADIIETNGPTRRPTGRPTRMPISEMPTTNNMEITVHPVQLIFKSAPAGYTFSLEDRASLVRFISNLLEDKLDEQLELIEVSYAGILLQSYGARFRLLQRSSGPFSPQLPLLIKVRAPFDISDFALAYIIEVLSENMQDLARFLKALDYEVFVKPNPVVETYNFDEISDTSNMVTTDHPVRLIFDSAPFGYVFTSEARSSIVIYIDDILYDGLGNRFELIEVSDAGKPFRDRARSMIQAGTLSLPLLVSVRGPADISADALPYIVQVIRDNLDDLKEFLESLDGEVFEIPSIIVETYKPGDKPVVDIINQEEEEEGTPWWVWLLVALGVLPLLGCLCFGCGYYYRHTYKPKREKRNNKHQVKEIVIEGPTEDKVVPFIVDKPFIVEKPVIIEKQVRDHCTTTKKHRKKKRRKTKKRNSSQSEQQTIDMHSINDFSIPYRNDTAAHTPSDFTFGFDPQSEAFLQIKGEDPYHVRMLAPTVGTMSVAPDHAKVLALEQNRPDPTVATKSVAPANAKALALVQNPPDPTVATMSVRPSYAKKLQKRLRPDASTYNRGFSARDPSVGGLLAIMNGRGSETQSSHSSRSRRSRGCDASSRRQSYSQKDPQGYTTTSQSQYSRCQTTTDTSQSRYSYSTEEPSGIYKSASQSQYTKEPSNVYSVASQSQYGYSYATDPIARYDGVLQRKPSVLQRKPSGHDWAEIRSHATSATWT